MFPRISDVPRVPFPPPRGGSAPISRKWLAAVLAAGLFGSAAGATVTHLVASPATASYSTAPSLAPAVDSVRDSLFRISARSQSGTGMLIREDLVLTNFHVISGLMTAGAEFKDPVELEDHEGNPIEGRVVMSDPGLDVALIQVPKSSSPVLEFRESEEVREGDLVAVLGFPFGLTMSTGVGAVGAVDQATSLRSSPLQSSLLQLSLSVNPGNSGGPVVDAEGKVLGMVTFRPDEVGGRSAQGMSFAIPSEDIRIALEQWEEFGDVKYGLLGAAMTQEGDRPEIVSVTEGGPADKAGLLPGDVIVAVGGKSTPSFSSVARALHERRPGDRVDLRVLRRGEQEVIIIEMGSPDS